MSDTPTLRRILAEHRTLAVVGLSGNWYRPSFFAAKYMQEEILGEKCYPDLASIPEPVDLVDIFQKPDTTPAYARQAVDIGASVVWLQLGIENGEAGDIARDAGLEFVQNHCVKIEHARIFGGLNFVGVNTKVITSHRSKYIAN